VGLSPETLLRFKDGYEKDPHLRLIYQTIKAKVEQQDSYVSRTAPVTSASQVLRGIDRNVEDAFQYQGFEGHQVDGSLLLYIKSPEGNPRLCIPASCHLEFLRAAHDDTTHAGFEKAYTRLSKNYYIRRLSATLRKYIAACPSCQRNKPTHHKPHGQLNPIASPFLPFEFVTMDLVVKLPQGEFDNNTYDSFMSVVCKLTKIVTLILGNEAWTAEDWASAFYHAYYRRWGVPQRILSDRGAIFLSKFWKALFRILRTELLVTTAYHPQTDGQSERTNQVVEIALRHLVSPNKRDWPHHLTAVEYAMNNLPSATTGLSPMQFLTGMEPKTGLDWATLNVASSGVQSTAEWLQQRQTYYREALDSITFSQARMSIYYDRKHQPITFIPGDMVYIILAKGTHPGYRLPFDISDKLSQRCVGPFKVIEAVGKLAYKLDLPVNWKIHPVISVVHLEKHVPDPYDRDLPPPPDIVNDQDSPHEEYQVEEIIRKRYNRKKKRYEYRVKWKGYDNTHNTWEPREHLSNAPDLLDEFEKSHGTQQIVSTFILPAKESPLRLGHYKTNVLRSSRF
jgi:hypothetical protein